MPDQKTRSLRTRLYQTYATEHAGNCDLNAFPYVFDRQIQRHLPEAKGAAILDIGCGQGALVRILNNCGYAAEGVDASPEQVRLAQAVCPGKVFEGDMFAFLADRQAAYEAILAIDVLEHLTKPEILGLLEAVNAALKPAGRFIARMPNGTSPLGLIYQSDDFTHETMLGPRSFTQACLAAGLMGVECFPCEPAVHGFKSLIRCAVLKGSLGVARAMHVAETGRTRGHILSSNFLGLARSGIDSASRSELC